MWIPAWHCSGIDASFLTLSVLFYFQKHKRNKPCNSVSLCWSPFLIFWLFLRFFLLHLLLSSFSNCKLKTNLKSNKGKKGARFTSLLLREGVKNIFGNIRNFLTHPPLTDMSATIRCFLRLRFSLNILSTHSCESPTFPGNIHFIILRIWTDFDKFIPFLTDKRRPPVGWGAERVNSFYEALYSS